MNRLMLLVICVLPCALLAVPAGADDPPKKLTAEERKELEAKWEELNSAGGKSYGEGKPRDAIKSLGKALELARQLYPKGVYPDGHIDLALSLSNLAFVLKALGKPADAESLYRDALEMSKRLLKGDHPNVALSLYNLASVLRDLGKPGEAESLYRDALEMSKRLFKGDHPNVAASLSNLASVLKDLGKAADAEPLYRDALEMSKRLFKGDHPNMAATLNNLASLLQDLGRLTEAEALCRDALAMKRRLYKGDHPDVALSLNSLASLLKQRGKLADAETLYRDALAMNKQLFKGDHPNVAATLNNLASILQERGKLAEAEPLYRDALEMSKRLFKGDHPNAAASLNNLALVLQALGKPADAELISRDALNMWIRMFKGDHPNVANSLNNLAHVLNDLGRDADAELISRDALNMRMRLFKGDHPDVAQSLNSLASVLRDLGNLADAELLFRDALAMRIRLFKGDHPNVANSLNNLALVLQALGKPAEAELLFRDAFAMNERLFKGDHPNVAANLNNLAHVLDDLGRAADAEPLFRDALGMRMRLFKGDHPDVALSLNSLASVFRDLGKPTDAEPLYREALDMSMRLFKSDHPQVARNLNSLAYLLQARGKPAEAEPLYREALRVRKRLFKSDHPAVAISLSNLAGALNALGKPGDAEAFHRDALRMSTRLVADYAGKASEGDSLTLLAATPLYRDHYLSNAVTLKTDPVGVYAEVWSSKGAIARAFERRLLAARAATDPEAARLLTELTTTRRRRADLILAPLSSDPNASETRDKDLKELALTITRLDGQLRPLLPAVERTERLAKAAPTDLQKVLPADAAVVDFLRFTRFKYESDPTNLGKAVGKSTEGYLAFVVTRDAVKWLDLGSAKVIDDTIGLWREAITSGKEIPSAIPAKVRELVWAKVRAELPPGVKVVYVSPDAALCRVPWAALPGDKPGTILIEDYAIATIPHAGFLLDKLGPADPSANHPTGALVVGGVKYDVEPATKPASIASTRDDPVLTPGQKFGWLSLDGAEAEGSGVAVAAMRKKLPVARLGGEMATTAAVLAALPKARHAHFATHGFFADPSFRSIFNVDPKQFEMRGGERRGAGVLNPLVMTGLVFAGANNPKTPGRGIVTGESLIDLDLSGLELAVLSACETGLGDVAGGEGTFGLQRAFHLAGTRDVVASLWKVPDQSTAALMAEFYRNLWDKNLPPIEALRQAQLTIYHNPGKIADLAKDFRGTFEKVKGADKEEPPITGTTSHPLRWAAFTLSGPGR